jgi:hypothetical protein
MISNGSCDFLGEIPYTTPHHHKESVTEFVGEKNDGNF